jgi:lysozyme
MNSELLRKTLRQAEGVKLKPYTDTVGKLTIGVGRNLQDVGLSLGEVDFLLSNDVTRAWMDLTKTYPWVMGLSDVRQRALTEMVFQLGLAGFSEFKQSIALLEHGAWEKAAEELLDSKWAEQVPSRAHRIAKMIDTDQDVP